MRHHSTVFRGLPLGMLLLVFAGSSRGDPVLQPDGPILSTALHVNHGRLAAAGCGALGQPCCAGTPACGAGLVCSGSCVKATCSGSVPGFARWFLLGVPDSAGCAAVISVWANSELEARLCVIAAMGDVIATSQPQSYCFKLNNISTVYVSAFSPADGARCAQNQCLNCSVTGC